MKRITVLAIIGILSITSCDKGFEDLNKNPLSPTDVKYGALFNSLVESLTLGWGQQLFLHNEVLYDVTQQAAVTAKTFGNIDGGSEDVWSNYYQALKNSRELQRRFDLYTEDTNVPNIVEAQMKVLMAYKTFLVTDLFGAIPYAQAGFVFSEEGTSRPEYDDHEAIYRSLIADLIWASDILTNSGGSTDDGNSYIRYGSFETLLNDNIDSWVRFTNSILLRYLIRMYDKDPEFVEPLVKDMIEGGANFVVDGGDIVMSPVQQNWRNLGVNWSFREHNRVRMGSTMWEFMTENNEIIDPRLRIFFETNNEDEWKAFPQVPNDDTPQSGGEPYNNGKRDSNYGDKGVDNIYSSVNFYLIRDEQDVPEIIITAAEVKFLLAEVFLRGIGVNQDGFLASFRYQEGILSSLNFWQGIMENSAIWQNKSEILTTGELFGVVNQPKYMIDGAGDLEENLKLIYAQRWVDAFRQPWEAFSLMRRTNAIPRTGEDNTFYRFKYPASESAFNSDNYNTQSSMMGGDRNDIKIWWMK